MKAYYFAANDNKLRYGDGRGIIIGKMHTVKGIPKLCKYGLHGSIKPLDALKYAPGNMLYIVDITRKLHIGRDKICGQRRVYLWGFDAEDLLREFAIKQAIINIEKIKPYTKDFDLIVTYLKTGDNKMMSAARSAALAAADSAEDAARSAAESAEDAAWDAARSAAWAAAEAAEDAAWTAARAAAWAAEESTERSAANEVLEQMINDKLKELQNVETFFHNKHNCLWC